LTLLASSVVPAKNKGAEPWLGDPPMPNLFMAILWLAFCGLLFGWHALHPDSQALRIGGSGPSLGWAALVLALYNLARWWSQRSYARRQRAFEDARQRHRHQGQARSESAPRNPAFEFTDPPPSAD
jgi:hypothetical protein